MKLSTSDYKKILKFYKLSIPKKSKNIKKKADKIIAKKFCSCIKKVQKKFKKEGIAIGICTKSVITRKGYKRGKFRCKKRRTVKLQKGGGGCLSRRCRRDSSNNMDELIMTGQRNALVSSQEADFQAGQRMRAAQELRTALTGVKSRQRHLPSTPKPKRTQGGKRRKRTRKKRGGNNPNTDDCVICLDPLNNGKRIIDVHLGRKFHTHRHYFHYDCIERVVKDDDYVSTPCPLCNKPDTLHYRFEEFCPECGQGWTIKEIEANEDYVEKTINGELRFVCNDCVKSGGKRRKRTRKKRGGDNYFDKHKKIIKEFLEHPEVAKKIKKHKKNKLSINQIMKKITRDKLNKIIKAYARYLKSQKGGKKETRNNSGIYRSTSRITVPRDEPFQPPPGEEGEEINFFEIVDGLIAFTEAQERQQAEQRQQRNQQRHETRFNMVHSLLFSMFMLLSVFGLLVDGTNTDIENIPAMNVLGQGIIMAHQTGLLGTAQYIMLWDVYWSFFNNAWIPGGFTGEDVIVHRQLARFFAPFFPLPPLQDEQEGGTANLCKLFYEKNNGTMPPGADPAVINK